MKHKQLKYFLNKQYNIVRTPSPYLKGGLTLPKIPRKGGMENLLKLRDVVKRGDSLGKGEML